MKGFKNTIFLALIVVSSIVLASCSKFNLFEDDEESNKQPDPVEITDVLISKPGNDPNHVTKIRLCVKNRTSNTLYYCKLTLAVWDDDDEVYRKSMELGSKEYYDWTVGPNETKWSEFIYTDFYVFGKGYHAVKIEETLFY